MVGFALGYARRAPVLDGRGSFQDTSGRNGSLDAGLLFSAVSMYCRRVTEPGEIPTALHQAVSAARAGGPAVLLLTKDIQQSSLAQAGRKACRTSSSSSSRLMDCVVPPPTSECRWQWPWQQSMCSMVTHPSAAVMTCTATMKSTRRPPWLQQKNCNRTVLASSTGVSQRLSLQRSREGGSY